MKSHPKIKSTSARHIDAVTSEEQWIQKQIAE